ncbi:hypothetical protein FJU30_15125 [Affinibrenneria salicis]|uniref:Uncharacterized protein n=1 Tax=Affinibrenneria salicis TaxID=2590031 RepID=A0A5J5FY05_9GAMM|nr:hypothetical protein FJU30_15125 [Affinibrenneria salicis]
MKIGAGSYSALSQDCAGRGRAAHTALLCFALLCFALLCFAAACRLPPAACRLPPAACRLPA